MSLGIWYCQLPLPSTVSTVRTFPPRLRVTVAPGSPLPCSSGVVSRVRSSTWLAPVSLSSVRSSVMVVMVSSRV
ncbi:hypothetical protein D3C85_1474500 [compost metagenome]